MAHGEYQCGYWSDHIGDVPLRVWPTVARNGVPTGAKVSVIPEYPAANIIGFQPRNIEMGYPTWSHMRERPTDAISMAGFGSTISAPGVNPGLQRMDRMRMITNRSRMAWTGPLGPQASWPNEMTPRGGVLDGDTLVNRGQSATSAYYYGASPQVMLPPDMINVLPNPRNAQILPQVGWGIQPGTSGFGQYGGRSMGFHEPSGRRHIPRGGARRVARPTRLTY